VAGYDLYTIARFWSKVKVGKPTQCWPWLAGSGEKGYGRFRIDGKLLSSHHVAWEMAHGVPLPDYPADYHGAVVRHSCDNPRCCNWRHLRHGTQLENVEDMDVKGRRHIASNAKKLLSAEQIATIISDPRPDRVLAEVYGISKTHVGAIKRGERCATATRGLPRDLIAPVPEPSLLPEGDLFSW
jgi:hypothetical protein